MKRTDDSFRFDAVIGGRLRKLRLAAGLTQDGLVVAMGRQGKRGGSIISRLEMGHLKQPSISLVADYLRACRATFADIAPVLDSYTRKPTSASRRVQKQVARLAARLPAPVASATLKYDTKLAQETGPRAAQPEEAARRIARAQRYAQAAVWRERLHRHILGIISAKKWGRGAVMESRLQDYCRRVWAVLERTRDKSEAERDKQLAQAEAKMLQGWTFDPDWVRHLAQATIALHAGAQRSGELG